MEKYILFNTLIAISYAAYSDSSSTFQKHGVVPDLIAQAPPALAAVSYQSGASIELGVELTPTQVKDQPHVSWWAEPNSYYTVALVDPDAPSRANPVEAAFIHWLVVNIPGNNLAAGKVISQYIGSGPPSGTGLHRYVFLVYKQSELLDTESLIRLYGTLEKRGNFSINKFAADHKFGNPVAGSFYEAQYDDYVPILYNKLGLS